uniref:Fermentation-respiration switch protein n=1 Tax=Pithovirus LCPAC403 TaxID=2506596 RepID=A0A481ZBA2_9VIRU|nr:MAG: fermentation-respiration switch protein [Pithovirus LCPAC403]
MNTAFIVTFVLLATFLLTFIIVHVTLDIVIFKESSIVYEIELPSEELYITEEGISTDRETGIHVMRYHIDDNSFVVLHCHGNNANLTARQYMVSLTKIFRLNLIIFDYHGYGQSSDSVSTKHLRKDTLAAYRYAVTLYSPDNIVIWGESLGGSLASWLASENECSKLVLVSAFSSLDDMMMCSDVSCFITIPFSVIVRLTADPLPTKKYLKNVTAPTLIIHSPTDRIVNSKNAMINFKSCKSHTKKFVKIRGDHCSPKFNYNNVETLLRFIDVDASLITSKRINKAIEVLNSIDMSQY